MSVRRRFMLPAATGILVFLFLTAVSPAQPAGPIVGRWDRRR